MHSSAGTGECMTDFLARAEAFQFSIDRNEDKHENSFD